MAYPGDPNPYTPDPHVGQTAYGYEHRDVTGVRGAYDDRAEGPRPENVVTAGPFRFGLKEGILGIVALFAVLGLVLGILGFAAAFALDDLGNVADDGLTAEEAALLGTAALPAILVSLLPFMAAPVLALGCGAWAGHAAREARIGALAGAAGGFLGPIVMLLITGIGFALGAGAANLNLDAVVVPYGISPGWANTIPYLFTGAGLLWLVANTVAGGLSGGVVGALLDRHWGASRTDARRRRAYERRTLRY